MFKKIGSTLLQSENLANGALYGGIVMGGIGAMALLAGAIARGAQIGTKAGFEHGRNQAVEAMMKGDLKVGNF